MERLKIANRLQRIYCEIREVLKDAEEHPDDFSKEDLNKILSLLKSHAPYRPGEDYILEKEISVGNVTIAVFIQEEPLEENDDKK